MMVSKFFGMFTPKIGEDDPIWRAYFSNGLVQPPTRMEVCENRKEHTRDLGRWCFGLFFHALRISQDLNKKLMVWRSQRTLHFFSESLNPLFLRVQWFLGYLKVPVLLVAKLGNDVCVVITLSWQWIYRIFPGIFFFATGMILRCYLPWFYGELGTLKQS